MSEIGFYNGYTMLKNLSIYHAKNYNYRRSSKNSSKRFSVEFKQILVLEVAYISYNIGTCALPDMYALALRRCVPSDIVHLSISGNALLPVL